MEHPYIEVGLQPHSPTLSTAYAQEALTMTNDEMGVLLMVIKTIQHRNTTQ